MVQPVFLQKNSTQWAKNGKIYEMKNVSITSGCMITYLCTYLKELKQKFVLP